MRLRNSLYKSVSCFITDQVLQSLEQQTKSHVWHNNCAYELTNIYVCHKEQKQQIL